MTLENLTLVCNGIYEGPEEKKGEKGTGVAIDSRKIKKGYIFIAIKGERVDGHTFIEQVFEKGALCVICEERPAKVEGPIILVNCTLQALKDIGEFYRKNLDIKVVGITGSVGKTSTKEMIASVLKEKYRVKKTEGNLNNEIGLPLTVFSLEEEDEVAVLEMGISNFGEMHRLSKIAKPDICVLTNIGYSHLRDLKSQDGILSAKSEIFDFWNPEGAVFLNGDDSKLASLKNIKGIRPTFYGFERKNDIWADCIEDLGLKGTACTIYIEGDQIDVRIPLAGRHMVYNALAAAGVGRYLGLSLKEIKEGIESVPGMEGRSHLIEREKYTIIDDCYNANPVSMKAAIDLLLLAQGRKVAILGDMKDLGEKSDQFHKELGKYGALKEIDVIVSIGEEAKHIYKGIKEGGKKTQAFYFYDQAPFLEKAEEILKEGDTILVKASHSMNFNNIIETLSK